MRHRTSTWNGNRAAVKGRLDVIAVNTLAQRVSLGETKALWGNTTSTYDEQLLTRRIRVPVEPH